MENSGIPFPVGRVVFVYDEHKNRGDHGRVTECVDGKRRVHRSNVSPPDRCYNIENIYSPKQSFFVATGLGEDRIYPLRGSANAAFKNDMVKQAAANISSKLLPRPGSSHQTYYAADSAVHSGQPHSDDILASEATENALNIAQSQPSQLTPPGAPSQPPPRLTPLRDSFASPRFRDFTQAETQDKNEATSRTSEAKSSSSQPNRFALHDECLLQRGILLHRASVLGVKKGFVLVKSSCGHAEFAPAEWLPVTKVRRLEDEPIKGITICQLTTAGNSADPYKKDQFNALKGRRCFVRPFGTKAHPAIIRRATEKGYNVTVTCTHRRFAPNQLMSPTNVFLSLKDLHKAGIPLCSQKTTEASGTTDVSVQKKTTTSRAKLVAPFRANSGIQAKHITKIPVSSEEKSSATLTASAATSPSPNLAALKGRTCFLRTEGPCCHPALIVSASRSRCVIKGTCEHRRDAPNRVFSYENIFLTSEDMKAAGFVSCCSSPVKQAETSPKQKTSTLSSRCEALRRSKIQLKPKFKTPLRPEQPMSTRKRVATVNLPGPKLSSQPQQRKSLLNNPRMSDSTDSVYEGEQKDLLDARRHEKFVFTKRAVKNFLSLLVDSICRHMETNKANASYKTVLQFIAQNIEHFMQDSSKTVEEVHNLSKYFESTGSFKLFQQEFINAKLDSKKIKHQIKKTKWTEREIQEWVTKEQLKCPFDKHTATEISTVYNHIRLNHLDVYYQFPCVFDTCGKIFPDRSKIKRHMWRAHIIKPTDPPETKGFQTKAEADDAGDKVLGILIDREFNLKLELKKEKEDSKTADSNKEESEEDESKEEESEEDEN